MSSFTKDQRLTGLTDIFHASAQVKVTRGEDGWEIARSAGLD